MPRRTLGGLHQITRTTAPRRGDREVFFLPGGREVPMGIRFHLWRRWLLSIALFCHLCLAAVPVDAQPRFEGEGRVVAVDETQGTVTLDHGPILGLMPAMRMAFPVQQVERLQGLQVGAVVRFALQAREIGRASCRERGESSV